MKSVIGDSRILLPLLYPYFGDRGASYDAILSNYQSAYEGLTRYLPIVKKLVPSIDSLKTGLLLYNFPLNIFKFFVCTVASAFVYPIINNYTNRD